jgi:hypothetical protein
MTAFDLTVCDSFLSELRVEDASRATPELLRLLHDIETCDSPIALDLLEPARRILLRGSGAATERLAVFDLLIQRELARLRGKAN